MNPNSSSNLPPQFTAARVAMALGWPAQRIAEALKAVPHTGACAVDGHQVKTWTFQALPAVFRSHLDQEGVALGYSSGASLLECIDPAWRSVPSTRREAAVRLYRALAAPLQKLGKVADSDLTALGLSEYRRVFGYEVGERSWRRKLDGVVRRDGGLRHFGRLHLYLDERVIESQSTAPAPLDPEAVSTFSVLDPHVKAVADPLAPTPDQERFLLHAAFCRLADLLQDPPAGWGGSRARSALVDYLFQRVPGLSVSRACLGKKLRRLFKEWEPLRSPDALSDRRAERSGRDGHDCPQCGKLIHDLAVRRSSFAQAVRELLKWGKLCENCVATFANFKPRLNKSRVPNWTRRYKPNALTIALHRSAREGELVGPHAERDYSNLFAGDVFVADDMTTNERVSFGRNAAGGWDLFRVQMIGMADMRSAKALDFVMNFGNPCGRLVRRLNMQVYAGPSGVGMPRRGQYLENGLFRSKLVTEPATSSRRGSRRGDIDWREAEGWLASNRMMLSDPSGQRNVGELVSGMRERFTNLQICHAKLPTAKTIEGDFSRYQSLAENLPGHIGRNERLSKFDRLQDFIARCKAGKEDPRSEGILTLEELRDNYRSILERYNDEPQNGIRCRGLSPNELWAEHVKDRPLERLPKDLHYVFATTRRWARVAENGITIRDKDLDRYERPRYFGHSRLGELIGRRVEVLYNLDFPETITVRVSPDEWFTVDRVHPDAWDLDAARFKQVNEARWNFMKHSRMLAGNLSHPDAFTVERRDRIPELQAELGAEINAAEERSRESRTSDSRQRQRIRKVAAATGLNLSPTPRSAPRAATAANRCQELLNEMQEASTAESDHE